MRELIIIAAVLSLLAGCRKEELALPENPMESTSPVQIISVDSFKVGKSYDQGTKSLTVYFTPHPELVPDTSRLSAITSYRNGEKEFVMKLTRKSLVLPYLETGKLYSFQFAYLLKDGTSTKLSKSLYVKL